LIDLKGLGINDFLLLKSVGIGSVDRLAQHDPEALYEKLARVEPSSSTTRPPSRAQVKIWVLAARQKMSR
jgi:hypothetical protein